METRDLKEVLVTAMSIYTNGGDFKLRYHLLPIAKEILADVKPYDEALYKDLMFEFKSALLQDIVTIIRVFSPLGDKDAAKQLSVYFKVWLETFGEELKLNGK